MNIKFIVFLIAVIIVTVGLSIGVYQLLQENKCPDVNAFASVTCGKVPLNISFTCAGDDSDGNIKKYLWDFGDGYQSNKKNPNHTYYWKGRFYAQITVWDEEGANDTDAIEINIFEYHQPVASASANTICGKPSLKISFNGSGYDPDGWITSYSWEFGDGSTSNKQNPIYTYDAVGKFYVRLTVIDNDGEIDSDSLEINVIDNYRPTAHASADVTVGRAPLTVNFVGDGEDKDGAINSYKWVFEDALLPNNRESEDQNLTHIFWFPGTYLVKLTVSDNDGATDTDVVRIKVEDSLFDEALQFLVKRLIKKVF